MNGTLHIYRNILRNGVEIKIRRKRFKITYPQKVWNSFPKSLHKIFADSLAYIATWHLPLVDNVDLAYHFAHPLIEPVFFRILVYSIPMIVFESTNELTSELLKKFYNSNFKTKFKALNSYYPGKKIKRDLKERAILLFSFGKDSLLTYAMLDELDVAVVPFFMKEPHSVYENMHKRKLADKFYDKVGADIEFYPLSIGRLRQDKDLFWGWDIILSQYAFILIPYYFYLQAKYLFFGNEQSCNFFTKDSEGFLINPTFEQSVSVMQLLQDIPKHFFINTHIGSLVEPIHEIFITYILHHRYSDIGKFQMSCFSDEDQAKKRRWCGHCEKCARMYIFFKALNISPDRVGFYENNMLSDDKTKYFQIFNDEEGGSAYGGSGLGRDEQLLAFYLASKNGVRAPLMDRFKNEYLDKIEKKKDHFIDEFFGIHTSYTVQSDLRRRLLRLLEKERESALRYISRIL